MLVHYLKVAWRNIWGDKLYSAINLIGLTVAFTVVFLFVQWIRYELSFENSFPNASRIYAVQEVEKRADGYVKKKMMKNAVYRQLKEIYPILEDATFTHGFMTSGEFNQELFKYLGVRAPLNFFQFFPMKIIAGTDAFLENRRKGIFISEKFAKKVFGNPEKAVNFEFTRDRVDGKTRIDGVVRVPENSTIQFDILYFSDGKELSWGTNYIMLKKGVSFTEEQQRTMANFPKDYLGSDERFIFEPLKKIHLFSDDHLRDKSSYTIKEVRMFGWIVVLLLLVAVINYVNTSTARAMSRSKEVVVRKISGSNRNQLILRFLAEAFILSLIAVFLALDMAKLLHHPFENIIGSTFIFRFDLTTLLLALLISFVTALFSGSYAAFYLSSINFLKVTHTVSKSKFRYLLVGLQFAISIGVLICTWTVYRQLNYMLNKNLGFNKENIYYFDTSLMYESEEFIYELQRNPYVLNATMASSAPYNVPWEYNGVSWLDAPAEVKEQLVIELACDHRFADVFELQVVQGEFIPRGLGWFYDVNESSYSIVVNETFKKIMGVENPVGMMVEYGGHLKRRGKVIGVVKDFYFRPMNYGMSPLIISFNPEVCGNMYIKIDPNHEQEALQHIRGTYDKMKNNSVLLANRPFILKPLESEYKDLYKAETRLQKILNIFALLSVVLSFMGIIGMIDFLIEKRTKEIGIRKINGATWLEIVKQFWKEFLILVGIAAAPAILIALLLMHGWLQQYVYRATFGWWIFILIPLLIAAVTVFILFLQVQGIAKRNPVECLKSE